jgi:hypothetical protein
MNKGSGRIRRRFHVYDLNVVRPKPGEKHGFPELDRCVFQCWRSRLAYIDVRLAKHRSSDQAFANPVS